MADASSRRILVIEDDPDTCANLRDILELDAYGVEIASTVSAALKRTEWSDLLAVILDRKLPDGLAEELLPRLKGLAPDTPFIVATAYADLDGAVAALRNGAADYILKPINAGALRASLARVAERRRLAWEKVRAEKRLATQYAVTRALADSDTFREAVPRLLSAVCGYVRCDLAELWRVDETAQVLRLEHACCCTCLNGAQFEATARQTTFPIGTGLPGIVWATGQPQWIADVTVDPKFLRASIARETGLHGAIAYPIHSRNEVAAVMLFLSREPVRPEPDLAEMLESLTSQAGHFMDRKLAEESLRESEERFRHLVEAAACMIVILRPDHTIAYFSPFAEELTGHAARDVLGKDYFGLFLPKDQHSRVAREIQRMLSGGQPSRSFENPVLCKDALKRSVLWNARALPNYEGGPGILAVGHDITSLNEAQERLVQSERLAAIGQMMAGLAHESRNALQRSQACLEMLAMDLKGQPEALELVADIQKAQDHLHHLYEEVRGYSAPVKLKPAKCHLGELLDEVWTHLALERQGRKAYLAQQENGADLYCHVDGHAIGQVFRNILENSLNACMDPVEICAEWLETTLNGRPAVHVSLCDNGPGLTAEARRRIFEPFFTTKSKGTGLGMAIAKRIVESHGGQIQVGSAAGRGAEIVLTLPRKAR